MEEEYNNAGAAPQGPTGNFADDYDNATPADGSGDQPAADAAPLDIPAGDVTQMQSLKDGGDMEGLGKYVSQFLK